MPMMDNRTRFNVPSAALCFGSLADILRGTTAPIQDARNVSLLPSGGGTVLEHDMEHNVGARKGPWSLYELIDETTEEVVAWFAASDEVDALDQIQRILATSPSPYDLDPPPGCRENNDDTRAGRVLVVGRYDWSDEQEEVRGWECEGCWLGLVDRARGQAAVEVWRPTPPDERAALPEGVWLYIPRGEYMFVRLGFADDALSKAVSFLFFTGHTDFSRVTFPGQQTPLSRNICLFDRLQGWMRDGRDLAGAPVSHITRTSETHRPRVTAWGLMP